MVVLKCVHGSLTILPLKRRSLLPSPGVARTGMLNSDTQNTGSSQVSMCTLSFLMLMKRRLGTFQPLRNRTAEPAAVRDQQRRKGRDAAGSKLQCRGRSAGPCDAVAGGRPLYPQQESLCPFGNSSWCVTNPWERWNVWSWDNHKTEQVFHPVALNES